MKKFINLGQFNKITLGLLILGVGIGLLVTTQWRTKPLRVSNPVTSYVSLKDTRDKLSVEQDGLKKQITSLQKDISQRQNELKKYQVAKKTVEEAEKLKEKTGLTEARGKGVIVKMNDSGRQDVNIDSITHAADLRDTVNFLWGIGAEDISINGERVVFTTSIDCIVNTILINNTKTTPPFEILALGDSKNISEQLENPNNLKDIKKRVKNEGLIFEIFPSKDLTINAYKGSFVTEHSKITE